MEVPGRQRTVNPYVTGSSVIAMRCADGVVMAADTLASYGSMARYRNVERMYKIDERTVVGASGEYSDFQEIMQMLEADATLEYCIDDGHFAGPSVHLRYLARQMYLRRNKMDPFYNSIILAGFENGKGVLGLVDLVGTNFESEVVATGFGLHLGLPLLRKAYRPDITVAEAKPVLEGIMAVLFYRDTRASDKIQITEVTKEGSKISEPFQVKTEWEYKMFIEGVRSKDNSTW